jgi:hypothetical protein
MSDGMDDFSDLLGLEKGEELVIKKDGEVVEIKEEKKEEPKPAPKPAQVVENDRRTQMPMASREELATTRREERKASL